MSDFKVLMTGLTTQQIGRPNRLGYRTVASYFVRALEEAGCQVDIKPVVPGEDLRAGGYDAAFVGMNSPRGLPARYMYGALDVISRAREDCGGRLALYLDDWQLARYPQQARSQARTPETMFDDHKRKCRVHVDEALEIKDRLVETLESLGTKPWPRTIYPSYSFGDTRKLIGLDAPDLLKFDPNPWAIEHAKEEVDHSAFVGDQDRDRVWVNASLVAHDSWLRRQKFGWPLVSYGATLKTVPGAESLGQAPELEVRARYSRSWGVLSPKYRIGGSGWWRVRALHAVVHRAVWYGDPAEMGALGPAWQKSAAEIEALSTAELRALADEQWTTMHACIPTKEEAALELRKALESAYI